MANYYAIKAAVNAYIKANGKKEITGRILNSVLNATIDSLGKGFQFGGVLTPADDPGQPDQNVAYIGAAGTYSNFDNLVIESGNIGIFLWNGDWSFETIPVGKDYDNDIQSLTNGLQELSDNVIHLDGINEEDLSIPEGGKLQFANRVYNAQQPNGMGYVILRKNKTFAEQVTEANTIYEIRYEFVMTGDFTMPSGCVLRFNGGSISGAYDFTGNKTGIIAPIRQVFGTNIRIAGTWEVEMAFPEWFGAAGNGVTDDTYAIQNCFLFKSPTLMTRVYLISQSVRFYNSINGNGASLKYGADCFMYSQGISDFYVRDLKIDGQSLSRSGIRFDNVQNVVIDNCTIENIGNQNIAQVSALYFATSTNCKNAYIQGCKIKNVGYDGNGACSGIGFSNHAGDTETANNGLYVYDCRFEGFNTSSEDSDCIKILSDNGLNTNVVISGCFFTGIGKRAVKTQAIGVKLIGNTYEVVTPIYAVVSFQRGGGESLNDTLIVNPADGETSEYLVANVFECAYGDVSISGFNTIVKNSVNVDGSHMMFCYIG